MKRFYILLSVFSIIFFSTMFVWFPYTLQTMEGEDLFFLTKDFIVNVLKRNQGVTILLQDFLCQFFSVKWLGALVYTFVVSLSIWLLYQTLKKFQKTCFDWAAFIPAPIIVFFSFPFFDFSLCFLFFCSFLYTYTIINSTKVRGCYQTLLAFTSFAFMPWYISVILFVSFVCYETFCSKSKNLIIISILSLLICLYIPRLWSDFIDFIPFDERPFLGINDTMTVKIIASYLLVIILCVSPLPPKQNKYVSYIIAPLLTFAFAILMTSDKDMSFAERTNKISIMADNKDWYGILEEIPYEDAVKSDVLLKYRLLALNATGYMSESLFSYPVNSPETFLFRHNQRPFYTNFNRQFYDNIGIWDEAFHQAFEYGVTQRENDCFRALRFKTDYALNSGDLGVAQFYINLLSKSCCNGVFVESRNIRLEKLKKEMNSGKIKLPPYRSDTFVGAYPMPSEMFRLFERNPQSKKLLDYVLCSLLLNKEVEKFGIILAHFNLYKGQKLPRSYAEALAALASRDPSVRTIADYDNILDKNFADFMAKHNSKQNMGEYASTYWYYLMYCQVAPLPDFSK